MKLLQIYANRYKNLEEYLLNIESSKLDKVVEKVYESETIYFLGLGSSHCSRILSSHEEWVLR